MRENAAVLAVMLAAVPTSVATVILAVRERRRRADGRATSWHLLVHLLLFNAFLATAGVIRLSLPERRGLSLLLILAAAITAALVLRRSLKRWQEVCLDASVIASAATLLVYEALLLLRPLVGEMPSGVRHGADVLSVAVTAWLAVISAKVSGQRRSLYLPAAVLLAATWTLAPIIENRPSSLLATYGPYLFALTALVYGILGMRTITANEQPVVRPSSAAGSSMRSFTLTAGTVALTTIGLLVEPQINRAVVFILVGLCFVLLALRQLMTLHDLREVGDHVRERERRFRSLLADSTDVIMICDATGRIEYVSPAAENVLGRGGAVEGQYVSEVLSISRPALEEAIARIDINGGTVWVEGRRGNQILEAALSRRGRELLASIRDVTERDRLRQRLHFLAYHDPLTGMVNRSRVLARIGSMMDRNEKCSVLFVDLDRFKQVNDNSGHDIGDQVLRQVATRLSTLVSDGDLIGRLGGDEFVAVVGSDLPRAEDLAKAVSLALAEPFEVDGRSYQLGASIGIALATPGMLPEELLRRADLAMYEAKRTRRSQVVYQAALADAALEQANLDVAVSWSIRESSMEVYLQPLVDLATGQVVTVEALLRWRDQSGRTGTPMEMLDYARRSGRLAEITDWVLDQSLGIAARCPKPLSIAVNMPPEILITPGLPNRLSAMIRAHGVHPRCLELEVTEDQLLESASAGHAVQALRDLGVSLLIDDFGTGFSSLGYLVDLPMDGLKIDQRFTRALHASEAARSIVAALVGISRRLNLRVVAEGIETPDLHRWASDLGVKVGQGYWYGRPEPSSLIADPSDLRSWRTSEAAPFLASGVARDQLQRPGVVPTPRGATAPRRPAPHSPAPRR